jgi:very-short-patch-repair endonuclease
MTTQRLLPRGQNPRIEASVKPSLAQADFYWPEQRLIVETDSWRAHGHRAAYEQDRAKNAALQAAGYRVVRFTWHTPDVTIERRLRALLATAGTHPPHG